MALSCRIAPRVRNNQGEEVDSKLFMDLLSLTKNRELTKAVWAATRDKSVTKDVGLDDMAKDANGEPTVDAVREAFHLDDLLDEKTRLDTTARELDIINNDGTAKKIDLSSVAIDKAIQFNDRQENATADVVRNTDGTYSVEYEPISVTNAPKRKDIRFKRDLNNRLTSKLNRIGIDVGFTKDRGLQGIFDPLNAESNAEGMITMIKIAKGELGEEALPEEFAHLIVAGLRDNVFWDRMAKVLTPEAVKDYLGDSYESYRNAYSNKDRSVEEYLQEEVMGQILAESLRTGDISGVFERFWDMAIERFDGLTESEIRADIEAARAAVEQLTQQIMENDDLDRVIDKEKLLRTGKKLYALNKKAKTLQELAEEGEKILAKKINLSYGDMSREEYLGNTKMLENLHVDIEHARYKTALSQILNEMLGQMTDTYESMLDFADIRTDENANMQTVSKAARALTRFTRFSGKYATWISTMNSIESDEAAALTDDEKKEFAKMAGECLRIYNNIMANYRELKFDVLWKLVALHMGEDRVHTLSGEDKGLAMSIDGMLSLAEHDISFIDGTIMSVGNSRNELLQITHEIIVRQQAIRDQSIQRRMALLNGYQALLDKEGVSNSFMIERDAEGKKTGYFVSQWDIGAYEKARDAFFEELQKRVDLTEGEKQIEMSYWEQTNTRVYDVYGTKERLPFLGKYANPNFDKIVNTKAKKDYYDAIMQLKASMDDMLPTKPDSLFLAPQIRGSLADIFDGGNKINAKNLYQALMRKYIRDNDETEFGVLIAAETGEDDAIGRKFDMNGRQIRRVPVYFTHKLKNMEQLNTDATQSMAAYIAMATNFEAMDQVNDILTLMNEHINSDDFGVQEESGSKRVFDAFNMNGKTYAEPAIKRGSQTNIAKVHTDFLRMNLWGEMRNDLGTVTVGKKQWDKNMIDRALSDYITKVGLGFNVFSGIGNVTMGEVQMSLMASGGRHFGHKDLLWAHKEFFKLMPEFLEDITSANPHGKLYMLMRALNADEDFFRNVSDKSYQKNKLLRFMGGVDSLFMQSAGEFYLHALPMLAMLHHTKVKDGSNNDAKLYDMFEVKKFVDSSSGAEVYRLEIKNGTKVKVQRGPMTKGLHMYADPDGYIDISSTIGGEDNDISSTFVANYNLYVNRIEQKLHGGYATAEKGTANTQLIWRWVMRFRQWMPATYDERFSRKHYDAVMDEEVEGFYNTYYKYIKRTLLDLFHGHLALKLEGKNLDPVEIENIKKARAELITWCTLWLVNLSTGALKDKNNPWAVRMIKYQLARLELDEAALVPGPKMAEAFEKIVKEPIAGMDTIENLLNLIDFSNLFQEIQSGKYKGWSVWERSALAAMPYKNVYKAVAFKDDNSPFNLFN